MDTRDLLDAAGNYLRAATPPLLALSVLALAETAQGEAPMPTGVGVLVLVAWRAAVLGTLLWFYVALVWAATRPLRDRSAFQRLQHLRDLATARHRALARIQTTLWTTPAGQNAVVLNINTGFLHQVWLPETNVPGGAFVVLERTHDGAVVIDMMHAHAVESAHRHERRHAPSSSDTIRRENRDLQSADDATPSALISEIEAFLRGSGSR